MKRYIKYLEVCLLAICMGVLFNQCEKDRLVIEPPQKPEGDGFCGTVTDYDGNEYDVVKLGKQEWMAQNLRTTHYANGTPIPQGTSTSTTTAYRYCPDNSSGNVSDYGYLYNWKAVMGNSSSSSSNPSGVQGICPNGWHVPSDDEWTELVDYVDRCYYYVQISSNVAGALASDDLHTSSWTFGSPYYCNNSTGFGTLPAGYYRGNYDDFGYRAIFWSATEDDDYNAWSRYLYCDSTDVYCRSLSKDYGFSVRCVKD